MLIQSIALLVASMVTLAMSQSDCSPKFRSADGQPCAYLVGKSDTLRILSSILFEFPSPGEKTAPESREKLRRWTDSIFNNHDIRYPDAREVRALPPPDSLLWWETRWVLVEKSSLLALAEKDFIKEIEYWEVLPRTVILRPWQPLAIRPEQGPYYDANGRLTAPSRGETAERARGIQIRFRHR